MKVRDATLFTNHGEGVPLELRDTFSQKSVDHQDHDCNVNECNCCTAAESQVLYKSEKGE